MPWASAVLLAEFQVLFFALVASFHPARIALLTETWTRPTE
jgi:hypothetical protein